MDKEIVTFGDTVFEKDKLYPYKNPLQFNKM